MPSARPAAGGGRRIEVAPERLAGWLDRFAERHGGARVTPGPHLVDVRAADGARAEIDVPFPPLSGDDVVAHAQRDRRVGILLVRLGGYACGVAEGPRLAMSKVGRRPVHGRSAAGGWSQQRFARRREGQVRVALQAAADTAARLLLPEVDRLDAVVTGGDRSAVDAVLSDRRLTALADLATGPLLDVPEPRNDVLAAMPARLRAVRITVLDPMREEPDPSASTASAALTAPPTAPAPGEGQPPRSACRDGRSGRPPS